MREGPGPNLEGGCHRSPVAAPFVMPGDQSSSSMISPSMISPEVSSVRFTRA